MQTAISARLTFLLEHALPNSKKLTSAALLIVMTLLFTTTALAQKPVDSTVINKPVSEANTTLFANGIYRMKPAAFGITPSFKDLPISFEDSAGRNAYLTNRQKRDAARQQQIKDKGLTEEQILEDEINRQNAKIIKPIVPGAGAGDRPFQDPLVNKNIDNAQRTLAMPTPSLTFDGASQTDNAAVGIGLVLPPDVNGDVGLNHYVSSVNLVYKIFNKDGSVAAGPIRTNALFSGLPAGDPCRVNNDGDPVVVYDPLADRWHISQFAITGGTNCQCVAVSKTGDPTGAYYVWRYDYPLNLFNDYPKVGVWPDAYHMTFNQFNNAGTAFLGMGFLSQDRPKALAGDPTASVVYKNIQPIDPNAGGALPADVDGILPPPAGMAEVIAEYRADEFGDPLDGIRYYKWVPDFINPGSSTLTILPDVALAPFDARNPVGRGDIEQFGGANLDAISDRLMHRFAYRNLGTQSAPINSYVGNLAVNVSGVNPTTASTYQTGIRWFEMRRAADAFSVFDQGTHNLTPGNGASGLNNWMASIAQDNAGNIGLGFSQSSTAQRADIKIAGRTNNVLNSGVLNEGESLFHAAGGSQTSTSGRWGDYSSMTVDPVDDCTFWYTQEYYATTSGAGWKTRIGKFNFPNCNPVQKATITGTITSCASGLPVDLALVNATGGYFRTTGTTGTYTMTVSPGTYNISAGKGTGFTSSSSLPVTVANGQTATVNLCLSGVPVLAATTATLIAESCLPANGIIDPGETVTVSFGVRNTGGANTVNDIGTLQVSGGVTNPGAAQAYGVILALGAPVSRNFTFTADPNLVCGTSIVASVLHEDGTNNLGTFNYTLPTGGEGTVSTTSYTGPLVAIPDNNSAGVNIILPVSGVLGNIRDVNFRLDALAGCSNVAGNTNAAVTHTFNADLKFKLTSPQGTSVLLISGRGGGGKNFCTVLLDDDGGFPATSTMSAAGAITGNFAPESPLSAFDGENANGNWTLNVADLAAIDAGTVNRFSLIITGSNCCISTVSVPTITASPVSGTIKACNGTPSANPDIQQFTASGSDLTADILVTAPPHFQVSTSAGAGYGPSVTLPHIGGLVSGTIIYIRSAAGAPVGPIAGNVSLTSTGATTVNAAVSGTINPFTSIVTNPVDQTIVALNNASFSVTATGAAPLSYKWQESTDGGALFSNLSDAGVYSNTSTSTLNLTNVPGTMSGYKYKCVVTGACSIATSTAATLTVNRRPTVITYTGDFSEQYSDEQVLTAVLKDQLTNTPLAGKTVSFTIGVQSVSDGPGVPGNGTDASGIASATLILYQNIGPYNVISSFAGDAVYASSSDIAAFTITKENAIVDYTGPEFISVPCATCATTDVLLSASIRDTTAVYPLNDTKPGDIRKARVRFVDLNTNTPISGWLTPGLVNATDTTSGIVNYSWTVSLPNTGYDVYSIGVIVDNIPATFTGNYIGNTETVLSISRGSLGEFITGGGNVIPTNSNGQYASDAGKKLNFGFNVKYNKSFKNLKGNMNLIFRKDGRKYQIKATAMTSLSINSTNPCSKVAVFTSKANLQDITDPNIPPVGLLGGLTMQTTMTDNGEPGTNDLIGISLWDGNTLVYSSNWVSTQTIELLLNGGNLQVKNGMECTQANKTAQPLITGKEGPETPSSITVNAYPNPLHSSTTIHYVLPVKTSVSLAVYDHLGKKVAQLVNGTMNAGEHLARFDGAKLAAGTYIYSLTTIDEEGKPVLLTGKLIIAR